MSQVVDAPVPVEVELIPAPPLDMRRAVKLGLAGQAEIVTGRESLLALLVKKIRRSISLG